MRSSGCLIYIYLKHSKIVIESAFAQLLLVVAAMGYKLFRLSIVKKKTPPLKKEYVYERVVCKTNLQKKPIYNKAL